MRRVLAKVQFRELWWITFTDVDTWQSLDYWMICREWEAVKKLLHRGNASEESMRDCLRDLKRWGLAAVELQLQPTQYQNLIDAGRRDPRTAYEKLRARLGR